jgi:cation diffusion facilitator CzcD-associated flavoprotein CzcO
MTDAAALTGDVLVIGAGPAGLASAHYLEKASIAYVIAERTHEVASTWAHQYKTLRLNTASFVTHLPGKRMPLSTPIYPTGEQLYAYLLSYARVHNFNIRYGVEVLRVTPHEDGWQVETNIGTTTFRCVIIASGRYNNPYVPPLEGIVMFHGEILHAHDYRAPEPFQGKRVLVAGAGPSGVDIALEIAMTAKHPVYLAIRSDIVVARRYPYGLPDTAWQLIARNLLPQRWRKPFLDRMVYQPFPDAPDSGLILARNRTDRRGTSTPVRGRALLDAIRDVTLKPVAGIARFHENSVELCDGSHVEADSVILSTGYRPVLGFLDIPYETDSQGYPVRADSLDEGGTTEVLGYPGLYLVGRFYRGLGPLNNVRNEAKNAVEEIRARLGP